MPFEPPTRSGTPPLILVVDDELVLLDCLELVLQHSGYRVLAAQNGVAALRLLSRAAPDAIVLDLQMPLMDGLTFAREYARLPGPHAPIILLTASDRGPDALEQSGAARLIRKPFDVDALLQAVAQLVDPPAHGEERSHLVAAGYAGASG